MTDRPDIDAVKAALAKAKNRGYVNMYDTKNVPAVINTAPALVAYIEDLEARLAASEARDKVRREALEDAASRFIGYAEMHALKLMDGSITAAERMAIRGKVDRNFTYAYEVRAALAGGAA